MTYKIILNTSFIQFIFVKSLRIIGIFRIFYGMNPTNFLNIGSTLMRFTPINTIEIIIEIQ